jgi:flavin reductase
MFNRVSNMNKYAGAAPLEADRAEFLLSMRNVPGAVAIIAVTDGTDKTGMAATAWDSLCADPPMLLVCVNQNASAHGLINRAQAFSVNVLAAHDRETVAIFSAQRDLSGADRFLDGCWSSGPGGQPMLENALAAFECELVGDHVHGTHSIFIGKIRAMKAHVRADDMQALLYHKGGFAQAEAIVSP